jgi:hypothetical protein
MGSGAGWFGTENKLAPCSKSSALENSIAKELRLLIFCSHLRRIR